MTEQEWKAFDSILNIPVMELFHGKHRKLFLFLANFLPQLLPIEGCEVCRKSLQLFEGQEDRGLSVNAWRTDTSRNHRWSYSQEDCPSIQWFYYARQCLRGNITYGELWGWILSISNDIEKQIRRQIFISSGMGGVQDFSNRREEVYRQGYMFVSDMLGNPFQPVLLDPAWLSWQTGTIPKLAHSIYQERAFDRLPILADALEEAGCDNAEILAHCRQPGVHARGCWVVDLVLGKE